MRRDKILIIDDEKEIVNAIEIYLDNENVEIFKGYDGIEAIKIAEKEDLSLIIIDIMMPKVNGINAVKRIREFSNVPIIFLTAKGEEMDKILGLNVGADDYITKPFSPLELIARVKSNIRRYKTLLGGAKEEEEKIEVRGLELNFLSKELKLHGENIKITPTEFKILKLLMSNLNRVFSSEEIYERVWEEPCINVDTVMVHIRRIREKIEINPKNPIYLKVVWGSGYKIEK